MFIFAHLGYSSYTHLTKKYLQNTPKNASQKPLQNHQNSLKIFVQNPRIKTINTTNTHIIKPIIPKKYLIQKQPQTSSIKHTIKHTVTKHLHLSITRINTHDNTLLPYYYQIPTNRNHFSQYYRHYLKSPKWHKKYTQNTRKLTLY